MNRENVSKTLVKTISASPGYYAIPELKQTYDLWWNKLSQIFREEGLDNIPNHLSWNFSVPTSIYLATNMRIATSKKQNRKIPLYCDTGL